METYLNNKVLKCEVAVFGIRGIVHSNGLFNEIFNDKEIPMQINKVYETTVDITVKTSIDEFRVFTEVLWKNKTILNFKGYPNSTQLKKIEDLDFAAGANGYSQPFKNETLYMLKTLSFRFFIDEKDIHHDWNANDEFNWSE